MFELEELRKRIEDQDYVAVFRIIDELDEIYIEDKINKIYSYMVVLLIHLIKQEIEQRTTSFWDRSIFNSINNINRTNKRRIRGGYHVNDDTLREIIDEAYPRAIKEASYELTFHGIFFVSQAIAKFPFSKPDSFVVHYH